MATDKRRPPTSIEDEKSFDPALEWFRKRTAMTRAQVDALAAEMRRRVFFVTGLSDMEAIKRVQDSLTKALAEGQTFEAWQASARGLLKGPEFTEARLRTIFRTNLQNAFATGRYAELTSGVARRRRPYWRFSAVRDGRTTAVCAASHGTLLHMDHPWWKSHIPPLHFNCRSTLVPLTEAQAQAAGITEQPPDVPPPLGFGHTPDPVPAEAAKMPTPEEKAAREKKADEARQAEETAQAASSTATALKREARQATRAAEQAAKEADKAPPELREEKQQRADELAKTAQEKTREADKATKEAEEAREKAQKAAEGVPQNWAPTRDGLFRRFGKALAAPFIAAWNSLGNLWKRIPRGAKLRGEAGFLLLPPWQTNRAPEVVVRELSVDEIPKSGLDFGKLPELKKEARNVCSPVGRHSTPLTSSDSAKPINSVYLASKKKKIEAEISAIKRGEGTIVEITTTHSNGFQEVRFGYRAKSGNVYGIKTHQNGRRWRLYPVEGPDFVVLNEEEYKALKRIFTGKTTKEEFLLNHKEVVDEKKVLDLLDGTPEKQK